MDSNATIKGTQNRNNGRLFEDLISKACERYSQEGIAEIEKTPEPMKPIRRLNNSGQFVAVYERAAQPDYKGTIKGGQSLVFEAKYTDTPRIRLNAVTEAQKERLDKHEQMGAMCFVFVSFRLQVFGIVPWDIFKHMKEIYGHQYMVAGDMEPYEVKIKGILDFLPVALKKNGSDKT